MAMIICRCIGCTLGNPCILPPVYVTPRAMDIQERLERIAREENRRLRQTVKRLNERLEKEKLKQTAWLEKKEADKQARIAKSREQAERRAARKAESVAKRPKCERCDAPCYGKHCRQCHTVLAHAKMVKARPQVLRPADAKPSAPLFTPRIVRLKPLPAPRPYESVMDGPPPTPLIGKRVDISHLFFNDPKRG